MRRDDAAALPEVLIRRVLRPIIGILLRSGVHYARFAQIARSLYVDIAKDDFGIKGRPTNTSRIAMMTGLSRVQVRRELDVLSADAPAEASPGVDHVRHASRVLLGWHTDSRFTDAAGKPRALPRHGKVSFDTLYEAYSGKVVPATSMLKELKAIGAIEQRPDKRLIARARSYIPQQADEAALDRICLAISDLAGTASFNVFRDDGQRARFERFATNQLIPASRVDEFRDFLEDEGQAFLERADDLLTRMEAEDDETLVRLGVGVYQIKTPPAKPEND